MRITAINFNTVKTSNPNFNGTMCKVSPIITNVTPYDPETDGNSYDYYNEIHDDRYGVYNGKGERVGESRLGYGEGPIGAIKNSRYYFYNSSIEKNYGGQEDKVYFLDPNEGITSDIWKTAGYIVKDNEPIYPNIQKEVMSNAFSNSREDYSKHWKTVSEYFKRVEDADSKAIDDIYNNNSFSNDYSKIDYYMGRIKYAQKQQEICDHCIELYDETKELRDEKYQLLDRNNKLKWMHQNADNSDEKLEIEKELDYNSRQIKKLNMEMYPIFKELDNYYKEQEVQVRPKN